MASKSTHQSWAMILIFLGLLFLATNFGWFGWFTNWLWSLAFVGAGAAFLYVYYQNRERWWALIPGFALLAIGVSALSGNAAGGLFLALLGSGFAMVYISNKTRWWAIIPAGALFTLALIAWLSNLRPGLDMGWLFFLGIATTFVIVFLLSRQRWAIYPALGCLVLVLLTFLSSNVGSIIIALALVAIGVFLFWRQGKNESSGSPQPQ